jgi:hypothetical protein
MGAGIADLIQQAYVLNFPAFPASYTVVQSTAADLNATVVQGTAANLKCEPTQTDSSKLVANTKELGCSTMAHGVSTVLAPGTPVQLSANSLPCKAVIIRARPAAGGIPAVLPNVGAVYIGTTTVDIGAAYNSVWLAPGESITIPVADVSMLYVDADTANDAVGWLAVVQ